MFTRLSVRPLVLGMTVLGACGGGGGDGADAASDAPAVVGDARPADAAPADAGIACARVSRFDVDAEGWTANGTVTFEQRPTGGNPGGSLFIDNGESEVVYLTAPAAFLGDLSATRGGTLSWDGLLASAGGGPWTMAGQDYGNIRLTNGELVAEVDLEASDMGPPSDAFRSYSVPMTAAAWGVSEDEWTTLLSSVDEVRLCVEALYGEESHSIDNFAICPPVGD